MFDNNSNNNTKSHSSEPSMTSTTTTTTTTAAAAAATATTTSASLTQHFQSILIATLHLLTANLLRQQQPSAPWSSEMQHIVIVGGSFTGVSTAHRFLKGAGKSKTAAPYKVTLVSRDSHFFWNIAAPRAIVPGQIPDDTIFQPIAPGFAQYGADKFEFVLGSAADLDADAKHIIVAGADGRERTIGYDYLVIATGSRTAVDGPFKSSGSTEATIQAMHDFQARVKDAKSIVIAGAGATGVETAGELASEYGKSKRIILISSGPAVLPNRPATVSNKALQYLQDLGVVVKLGAKVGEPVHLPNGQQELVFPDGERLVFDMYVPTFGIVPNSSWIPSRFLDQRGFVVVDEHLGVKGARNVFAIGDISNVDPPQMIVGGRQCEHTAKNLVLIVSGRPLVPYKPSTTPMMGLQVGKNNGTGHIGNWMLPGFIVKRLRKTLFVEGLPKTIDGSAF